MIDDLVADATMKQQPRVILRQDILLPQGAQQLGKGVFGHPLERTGGSAEKVERLRCLKTTVLRDGRQELLHERGVVRPVHGGRLEPIFQQERNDGRSLYRVQSKPSFQASLRIQGAFDDIAAQDCRFALASAGTAKSLSETCNGWWRADLHYASDRPDVDA